jgi:hypothetical protein
MDGFGFMGFMFGVMGFFLGASALGKIGKLEAQLKASGVLGDEKGPGEPPHDRSGG